MLLTNCLCSFQVLVWFGMLIILCSNITELEFGQGNLSDTVIDHCLVHLNFAQVH